MIVTHPTYPEFGGRLAQRSVLYFHVCHEQSPSLIPLRCWANLNRSTYHRQPHHLSSWENPPRWPLILVRNGITPERPLAPSFLGVTTAIILLSSSQVDK